MRRHQFHALTPEEVEIALQTDLKNGLGDAEVKARLAQYGPNRLAQEAATAWWHVLLRQFTNFLILILLVAALLSYFLGDWMDMVAILAIVALNGVLGFAQEWKAQTALAALQKMLTPFCHVIRNGSPQQIDATLLVPGDIVLLESGALIPADMRLIDAVNVKADESALTGESVAVTKDSTPVDENAHLTARTCMAWMGTHIVNGHARGIVTATGMNTEFGRISALTGAITETPTRLQNQLRVLAHQLTIAVIMVTAIVVFAGWLGGRPLLQMVMAGISLSVAAVPEGLPAVVTITLALGMRAMARRKALLRHLQTAETLGATSVICTDKTGTLTKNEMTIQKIWLADGMVSLSGAGYDPTGQFSIAGQSINPLDNPDLRALLEAGRVCNHAHINPTDFGWVPTGSPTEAAFITAAQKAGLPDNQHEILCEFSFNGARKRMSVIEKRAGNLCVHIKGAPEIILARADKIMMGGEAAVLNDEMRQRIIQAYEDLASQGLRTLALAQKTLPPDHPVNELEAETRITFLGIAGIIDPPRPEARAALMKTAQAGIRVIMITGDSPNTALAVARQLGLKPDKTITGSDLALMSDQALSALLQQEVLFARTVPEDKYRIVKILQAQNQIVAMTGDGVNDAPALKQADIGIAMGIRGTDVAKGASDMVLSDDNFASIVSAIEEGRRQYANIRKFINYLIAHNFGETMAVFINILTGSPLILLPVQILWVNLVTDGLAALSLSLEKAEANIMQRPPRNINKSLLDRTSLRVLFIFGSYVALMTLWLYHFYLDKGSYGLANTVAFTAMVILSNTGVLNFRSLEKPTHIIGWFSNPWLIGAVVLMLALQACAIYHPALQDALHTVPLGLREWFMIMMAVLPILIVSETYKGIVYRRSRQAALVSSA